MTTTTRALDLAFAFICSAAYDLIPALVTAYLTDNSPLAAVRADLAAKPIRALKALVKGTGLRNWSRATKAVLVDHLCTKFHMQ